MKIKIEFGLIKNIIVVASEPYPEYLILEGEEVIEKDKVECCEKHSDTCTLMSLMSQLCCKKCPSYRESWEEKFGMMVRDFTAIGFMSKGEAKRRFKDIINKEKKALLESLLMEETNPKTWTSKDAGIGFNQAIQKQNTKIRKILEQ